MHCHHSSQLSVGNRFLLIFALAVAAILAFVELDKPLLAANDAGINGDVKAVSAPGILPYRWNLDDHALPLLTLPDRINKTLDLSLTYSLDQFQFPFLQTLYYNKRSGKYILMVMPKGGGRAEFIDLVPVSGRQHFAAKGNSKLRLEDRGHSKLLTTGEGTVYTFARFGDGEFHCSQIKGRHGSVITLKYKQNASIDRIVDISGRTIIFGYERDYVSTITQTWGTGAVKKQIWSIAESAIAARPTSKVLPATGAEIVKRLPKNALIRAYTPAMAASDLMLAAIFGGPGAVAAAHSFEPRGLGKQYPLYRGDLMGDDGKLRRGHLSYAMHLYGSANGTSDTEIYVPSGFT
ncbi:MAG: hypothetical protein LC730_03040, partial [Acidobacteria bacterium]|nr:hypothetical protein [Acidobacteriota bacterium]